VVAFFVAIKVGRASCPNRPPPTHGSPQRRRQAVLEKPDPGQGSRGAPFGMDTQQSAHPFSTQHWRVTSRK
jgi:hypothetical protein